MRLNSVRFGAACGVALFALPLLLGVLFAPREQTDAALQMHGHFGDGAIVSPPPTDFEALANPPTDNSHQGRVERLMGSYAPEQDYLLEDYSGHDDASEVSREQRLAQRWCVAAVAKHARVSEIDAGSLVVGAIHLQDPHSLGVVLSTLESVSSADAESDLVRRRQCAVLLYLGMMGSPPMLTQ